MAIPIPAGGAGFYCRCQNMWQNGKSTGSHVAVKFAIAIDRNCTTEWFIVSRKRRTALSLCFDAIPDGKPLHTFPGIAQAIGAASP
jgi:hypothetical protein